jgi:hypothetical protein
MEIIEEIEKWVAEQVAAPEWILRNPRIADGITLARRAVARLRELEGGHTAVGHDFRWAPDPRGEATAPSTIERYLELARRVEALENPDTTRWGSYVEGYVRPLAQRIEALEAREEARAAPGPPRKVRRPCGAFCNPDEGFHTEGCRYRYEPMPKAQPTRPGAREFRSDLDDDMRYESGDE